MSHSHVHGIGLHLVGVIAFFVLIVILLFLCRIADQALVPPSRRSSKASLRHSAAVSCSSVHMETFADEPKTVVVIPMHDIVRSREGEMVPLVHTAHRL